MPEPWRSKEWKKRRASLIQGKTCEWCGSTEDLSPHHPTRYAAYEVECQAVSQTLLRKLIKKGVYTPLSKDACPKCSSFSIYPRKILTPKYRCISCNHVFDKSVELPTGWISKEDYSNFRLKHKDQIDKMVKAKRQKAYEEYTSLEGTIILCRACHLAAGRGRVLCKVCKKKYHEHAYQMCWDCFSKTERGQEVAKENELVCYSHPWCGKVFHIKRMFMEIESNPQMCCIEHCNEDQYSCETANKNWDKVESEEETDKF